jgi:hypothetical protein
MSIGKFDYDEDDPEDNDYVIDENIRMPILWFDEIMENDCLDI